MPLLFVRKGSYNTQDYRYGFDGKEIDNEVKGECNQQDYDFRLYNPFILVRMLLWIRWRETV